MVRLRTAVIFEGNLAFQVWDVADPARIFRASATYVRGKPLDDEQGRAVRSRVSSHLVLRVQRHKYSSATFTGIGKVALVDVLAYCSVGELLRVARTCKMAHAAAATEGLWMAEAKRLNLLQPALFTTWRETVIQHYQALQHAARPWYTPRVYPFEFWHLAPLGSWEPMLGRGPPEPGLPYPAGFVPRLGFEPDSDEDGPLYI